MLDRLLGMLLGTIAPPRCASCDERLAREAVFCAPCLATVEPSPELPLGTTASFAYGGAVADAIRSCKFQGRVDRLRLLSRMVSTRLPSKRGLAIDVVAPVPLHVHRLRERGFDQAAILAQAVGRALRLPCEVDLLQRVVDTAHLALLDVGGRRAAIEGAFVSRPTRQRVLLIDDVRTTGATLHAAAEAIVAAGGVAFSHVLAATPRA